MTSLFAGTASAGQFDLIVNGLSYHADTDHEWNESNYGLGFEYQFDSDSSWIWSLNANAFIDSVNNMSYMAGGGLRKRLIESDGASGFYFDAGLNAFMMSRKDVNDYLPFPGILPTISTGFRNLGINLTYLPAFASKELVKSNVSNPDIGAVYFVQFRVRMNGPGD